MAKHHRLYIKDGITDWFVKHWFKGVPTIYHRNPTTDEQMIECQSSIRVYLYTLHPLDSLSTSV